MTSNMFMYALSAHGVWDASTQQTMLRVALATSDTNTLVALCGIDGLCPDVDDALGSVDNLAVRRAWIARPNRTTEQIIAKVASERRQTVLTAIVEQDELPDEVWAVLAPRCTGVNAMLAVITSNAPDEIRAATLLRFINQRTPKLNAGQRQELSTAIRNNAALATTVFTHTTAPALMLTAAGCDLDIEVPDATWDNIERVMVTNRLEVTNVCAKPVLAKLIHDAAVVLERLDAPPDLRRRTLEAFDAAAAEIPESSTASWPTGTSDHLAWIRGSADPTVDAQLATLGERVIHGPDALGALDELSALHREVGDRSVDPASVLAVVERIAGDPATAPRVIGRLANKFSSDAAARAIDATAPDDLRRCVELASVLSEQFFGAALDRYEHPLIAFEVWLHTNPPVRRLALASEQRADTLPDRLIWQLPSKIVSAPMRDTKTSQTCRRFVTLLCQRFGDDIAKWQLFGELAGDHDGTAEELAVMVELGVDS